LGSDSEDKARNSAYAQRKGHVVEDERGRRIWQGTIRQVKLSLMKTGIFVMSESQRRLNSLRGAERGDAGKDVDEDLEFIDDGAGFDPYDSAKK